MLSISQSFCLLKDELKQNIVDSQWLKILIAQSTWSTHCMLGHFSCFCCGLLTFFKVNIFKKNLGPNCLQTLSNKDIAVSKGRVIENTRWVSFDIKFTRQGYENACWHREACRAIQHAFSKPSLVNLISKDANLVFYLSFYPLFHSSN